MLHIIISSIYLDKNVTYQPEKYSVLSKCFVEYILQNNNIIYRILNYTTHFKLHWYLKDFEKYRQIAAI